jgi:putative flippase GtrA
VSSAQARSGAQKHNADANHLQWERQFFRYLVVGAAANGAGYLVFFVLTAVGLDSVAAISILYPTQIALAFVLNRRWAFGHEGKVPVAMIKYVVAYAACYLLNVAALKLFADHMGLSHLAVQACAVVVLACLLFLVQRYWVFRLGGGLSAKGERS